uniref:Uncharacterized protein n=1 Tax=viral metagenome TaxID=1070528 RepID=A0A6C0BPU8_9ZZZZ
MPKRKSSPKRKGAPKKKRRSSPAPKPVGSRQIRGKHTYAFTKRGSLLVKAKSPKAKRTWRYCSPKSSCGDNTPLDLLKRARAAKQRNGKKK